jgi:hypothetical protein
MATNVVAKSGSGPSPVFWTLIGVGVLALLLAAGWRVANGAELEAKGKEWSLKVNEAANTLDSARKQLEVEAQRLKDQAASREAYWTAQVASAKTACPRAAEAIAPPPPVSANVSAAATERALSEVARTADSARDVARDIGRLRVPKF